MCYMILANFVGPDILIVIAVIALVFGGSQIPKLARSLGSAKNEFQRGIDEGGQQAGQPAQGGQPAQAAQPAAQTLPPAQPDVQPAQASPPPKARETDVPPLP